MERPCQQCGKAMLNPVAKKRFCSTTCRVDAHKGAPGVTELRPSEDRCNDEGVLTKATRAELAEVGRESTSLGAAALVIAGRIDSGQEPGSAVAALNRELRATMAEALRGVVRTSVQTARDELAERRRLA